MNFLAAKDYILDRLQNSLSEKLTYHGVHHTLDVLAVTIQLCEAEGISEYNTTLLKTAALYHDAGFLINNVEHEKLGCQIVRETLPDFDYSDLEIEKICGMIMSTKIPQSPQNYLEEIICDADLDYLGRSDFYSIGQTLFEELKTYNVIQDQETWNKIQVNFLTAHSFLTKTNLRLREQQKQQYLADLKLVVATYKD